ncbi:hypothetical protein WALSEDRAFT_43962 [Wallemia mellicola CBS 633.66]|uniref:Peptidase M48 domain-containing protein n=1 Tax=Wallemia mellicola (strain ATCC MYA-4683 / CBS 633.66) TaxID=671144 RepID=I4YGD9_WALMC|nr:hypothetical protein WALSEDRAFT_43962 [Wallemia mellicola CBS 633.66]EIM23031.1 hypothetical protein WALSEDRAFT_43962 [Wallemia mellicola CBS 633.66]|eukprot:XP_006957068.1 hypothetical protein WALSEDRAFT_43962 [Wallemia mellicola CBS 633.66]
MYLQTYKSTSMSSFRRFRPIYRNISKDTNSRHTIYATVGGVGVTGYYLYHLEENAAGRWRFLDVTPSQERQAGEAAYRDMLRQYRRHILPSYHPTARYVSDVASRIIQASPYTIDGRWEVFVIHSPVKNAMVLPGGKIFVFDGILPMTANKDGLAAVIGHEAAHQFLRHAGERMSFGKIFVALGLGLQAMGIDFGISHALFKLILELPNSRKAEHEADKIGMDVAARACFDPSEAIRVWQRMSASDNGDRALDFLSTHPGHQDRIEKLREYLPHARKIYDSSECSQMSDFSTLSNTIANTVKW